MFLGKIVFCYYFRLKSNNKLLHTQIRSIAKPGINKKTIKMKKIKMDKMN